MMLDMSFTSTFSYDLLLVYFVEPQKYLKLICIRSWFSSITQMNNDNLYVIRLFYLLVASLAWSHPATDITILKIKMLVYVTYMSLIYL